MRGFLWGFFLRFEESLSWKKKSFFMSRFLNSNMTFFLVSIFSLLPLHAEYIFPVGLECLLVPIAVVPEMIRLLSTRTGDSAIWLDSLFPIFCIRAEHFHTSPELGRGSAVWLLPFHAEPRTWWDVWTQTRFHTWLQLKYIVSRRKTWSDSFRTQQGWLESPFTAELKYETLRRNLIIRLHFDSDQWPRPTQIPGNACCHDTMIRYDSLWFDSS